MTAAVEPFLERELPGPRWRPARTLASALVLTCACAEPASVFSVTGDRVERYPGLLLVIETLASALEAHVLDPAELPLIHTLPEDASAARLIFFEVSTDELFGDVALLQHDPEGEPLPSGALELEVDLSVDGDGTWRERERSSLLAAFRAPLRKRCHVLEPEPPLPLGTSGGVVTITKSPLSLALDPILVFTEDGMRVGLLEDGTLSAPTPVTRPPPANATRLVWVESSGQKLYHFFDDGLLHVQAATETLDLQTPNRRIVAGDARLRVSGGEVGVITTDEELGLYDEREAAWVFIPAPGALGRTGTARMNMSRNSARVGVLSGDGEAWQLLERDRPALLSSAPGSGGPVYLRELDSTFRYHYVTAAGELYAETASSFELLGAVELDDQLVAAELSGLLGEDLYAVSARGELIELRDGSVCPTLPLDLRPESGFEVFADAAFVSGVDPESGERLIQRIRISEP